MAPDDANIRSEWENVSNGVIGVVTYDERGKRGGAAVKPGDTVWLTEPERIATANAPKLPQDNPFVNGNLICRTPASAVKSRRPFGLEEDTEAEVAPPAPGTPTGLVEVEVGKGKTAWMTPEDAAEFSAEPEPPREERPAIREETAAPPLPEGDPERGSRPPGEEVGSPEVVKQSGTAARTKPTPTERGVTVKTAPPITTEAPKAGEPVGVAVGQGGPQYAKAP